MTVDEGDSESASTAQPVIPKRSSRRRFLVRVVRILVLVYVGFVILLALFQTKFLFPAGGSIWQKPDDPVNGWEYEDVHLSVDGETTHGWWIPFPDARGTILMSHGNGGTVADRLGYVEYFREFKLNVFLYDYGGFVGSTGSASEKRCYADARAAWRFVTENKGIKGDDIILYGESLGGGVTVDLACDVKPKAVILQSTFLSVPKRAQEIFWFVPVTLMSLYRFDNAAKIRKLHVPILVIHSPDDTVIPFHHGQELFRLANEPKMFVEIRGDHNEGPFESRDEYLAGVRTFLDSLLTEGATQ